MIGTALSQNRSDPMDYMHKSCSYSDAMFAVTGRDFRENRCEKGFLHQPVMWLVMLSFGLSFIMGAAPVPTGREQDSGNAESSIGVVSDKLIIELTPELHTAVDRGLSYLATVQAGDGSFGASRYGRHVGITALACLAFMADGHLPERGAYGPNIQSGLEFILRSAHETGLIAADTSHGPMYGHGFAALFLAEVYGQAHDRRCREVLVKAVRLIINTQNPEGGWRYHPIPIEADISVTICQVMALRAARNAGISVPKETIEKAIAYVRRCQTPTDGGFRYMVNSGGSAFPRTAAGVASLYYAGVYQDEAINKGLDYLVRQQTRAMGNRSVGHYYYGHYYAVQAMHLAGGQYWAQWFPAIRAELLARQEAAGNWSSPHGGAYATAMSLLVLQLPKRLLPIFQR